MEEDKTEAIYSNQWQLLSYTAATGARHYIFDGYNETYPYITINFSIQRQSDGHIYQIYIPAVIMLTINIIVLLLSPSSMERFILLAINLFSHGIIIEQLRWM